MSFEANTLRTLAFAFVVAGCTQTLDAGYDSPDGLLPVDQRNPLILLNDGAYDNWSGEYAVMLANGGGSPLAGIIVNATPDWPDIDTNVGGYRDLVAAARSSGLTNLPDPLASTGAPLVKPASGNIDDTQPNRSEGALFIVDTSKSLSLPYRPLVIATGGALTDVADAYLVDPTVTARVVIVSSLGSTSRTGGGMGSPNGQGDPWADVIVTSKFRYVQVSAWYDQLTDVPSANLSKLPNNALGAWIASKQPNLWQWSPASDQVSVLAVGLSAFATAIERVSPTAPVDAGQTGDGGTAAGPDLATNQGGPDWLVTACDGAAATSLFWKVLMTTH
ncbi:MAG TPA: hypothetical protein VHO06_22090 [Polyangia bacterium]|nr:hypothetical protein [Polyangia bacterium]